MKSCYLFACLVIFHNVDAKWKLTPDIIGDSIARLKDSSTRSVSAQSFMHAMFKCIAKKACKYFYCAYVPRDVSSKNPCRCTLSKTIGNHTKLVTTLPDCSKMANYIAKFPKAIGGACADHRCVDGQVCRPLTGAGYTCKRGAYTYQSTPLCCDNEAGEILACLKERSRLPSVSPLI